MRILFVGNLDPNGRAFQRMRALSEIGHDITPVPLVPAGRALGQKRPVLERVFWKAGIPLDPARANAAIAKEAAAGEFDILWIEKGNEVRPATLAGVRKIRPGIKIACFAEDDMYARHNRSRFFTAGLKHYDAVFTTKSYNCGARELPRLGARRVIFVDKGYDIHAHRPVEPSREETGVGFIGSYERERSRSIRYLAGNGLKVTVAGSEAWGRFSGRSPNLLVEARFLRGDDYARRICSTRVNLCFLRKANRDLQTDRTMEIPACGSFMLAERTDEHLRLFREGIEAEFFESDEELLRKAGYYLEHERERKAIAAAGRQRCLDGGYSHHARLLALIPLLVEGGS